jgi:hypothetical protein
VGFNAMGVAVANRLISSHARAPRTWLSEELNTSCHLSPRCSGRSAQGLVGTDYSIAAPIDHGPKGAKRLHSGRFAKPERYG